MVVGTCMKLKDTVTQSHIFVVDTNEDFGRFFKFITRVYLPDFYIGAFLEFP